MQGNNKSKVSQVPSNGSKTPIYQGPQNAQHYNDDDYQSSEISDLILSGEELSGLAVSEGELDGIMNDFTNPNIPSEAYRPNVMPRKRDMGSTNPARTMSGVPQDNPEHYEAEDTDSIKSVSQARNVNKDERLTERQKEEKIEQLSDLLNKHYDALADINRKSYRTPEESAAAQRFIENIEKIKQDIEKIEALATLDNNLENDNIDQSSQYPDTESRLKMLQGNLEIIEGRGNALQGYLQEALDVTGPGSDIDKFEEALKEQEGTLVELKKELEELSKDNQNQQNFEDFEGLHNKMQELGEKMDSLYEEQQLSYDDFQQVTQELNRDDQSQQDVNVSQDKAQELDREQESLYEDSRQTSQVTEQDNSVNNDREETDMSRANTASKIEGEEIPDHDSLASSSSESLNSGNSQPRSPLGPDGIPKSVYDSRMGQTAEGEEIPDHDSLASSSSESLNSGNSQPRSPLGPDGIPKSVYDSRMGQTAEGEEIPDHDSLASSSSESLNSGNSQPRSPLGPDGIPKSVYDSRMGQTAEGEEIPDHDSLASSSSESLNSGNSQPRSPLGPDGIPKSVYDSRMGQTAEGEEIPDHDSLASSSSESLNSGNSQPRSPLGPDGIPKSVYDSGMGQTGLYRKRGLPKKIDFADANIAINILSTNVAEDVSEDLERLSMEYNRVYNGSEGEVVIGETSLLTIDLRKRARELGPMTDDVSSQHIVNKIGSHYKSGKPLDFDDVSEIYKMASKGNVDGNEFIDSVRLERIMNLCTRANVIIEGKYAMHDISESTDKWINVIKRGAVEVINNEVGRNPEIAEWVGQDVSEIDSVLNNASSKGKDLEKYDRKSVFLSMLSGGTKSKINEVVYRKDVAHEDATALGKMLINGLRQEPDIAKLADIYREYVAQYAGEMESLRQLNANFGNNSKIDKDKEFQYIRDIGAVIKTLESDQAASIKKYKDRRSIPLTERKKALERTTLLREKGSQLLTNNLTALAGEREPIKNKLNKTRENAKKVLGLISALLVIVAIVATVVGVTKSATTVPSATPGPDSAPGDLGETNVNNTILDSNNTTITTDPALPTITTPADVETTVDSMTAINADLVNQLESLPKIQINQFDPSAGSQTINVVDPDSGKIVPITDPEITFDDFHTILQNRDAYVVGPDGTSYTAMTTDRAYNEALSYLDGIERNIVQPYENTVNDIVTDINASLSREGFPQLDPEKMLNKVMTADVNTTGKIGPEVFTSEITKVYEEWKALQTTIDTEGIHSGNAEQIDDAFNNVSGNTNINLPLTSDLGTIDIAYDPIAAQANQTYVSGPYDHNLATAMGVVGGVAAGGALVAGSMLSKVGNSKAKIEDDEIDMVRRKNTYASNVDTTTGRIGVTEATVTLNSKEREFLPTDMENQIPVDIKTNVNIDPLHKGSTVLLQDRGLGIGRAHHIPSYRDNRVTTRPKVVNKGTSPTFPITRRTSPASSNGLSSKSSSAPSSFSNRLSRERSYSSKNMTRI